MLKTTQLPTRLAVPNSAFTSPQELQWMVLLLTWPYHAFKGPSESEASDLSQNFRNRVLEITRIPALHSYSFQGL